MQSTIPSCSSVGSIEVRLIYLYYNSGDLDNSIIGGDGGRGTGKEKVKL